MLAERTGGEAGRRQRHPQARPAGFQFEERA